MRKIITMVGTSIFEHYFEDNGDKNIRNYYKDLMRKKAEEHDIRVDVIEKGLRSWFDRKQNDMVNLSAEIKSLIRIREELSDDLDIYLLCSDTVLSKLAGKLIKEILSEKFGFPIEKEAIVIKNLQIWDRESFNEGIKNLINKIYEIAGEYWDNVIINITGGYKASVPFLAVLAQINRCPIYYIFEDTDALIKIPYIPLDIRWEIFEKYEEFFFKLEKEGVSEIKNIKEEDRGDILSLIESVDNLYSLNPLGVALLERYKRGFKIFYVSGLFLEYVKSRRDDYKKIVDKSLLELRRRLERNPQDPDLDHKLEGVDLQGFKCFKHREGNLQVRILYKSEARETRYGTAEYDIYVGLICIGSDVHNHDGESEYIKYFENNLAKIIDTSSYEVYRIQKTK